MLRNNSQDPQYKIFDIPYKYSTSALVPGKEFKGPEYLIDNLKFQISTVIYDISKSPVQIIIRILNPDQLFDKIIHVKCVAKLSSNNSSTRSYGYSYGYSHSHLDYSDYSSPMEISSEMQFRKDLTSAKVFFKKLYNSFFSDIRVQINLSILNPDISLSSKPSSPAQNSTKSLHDPKSEKQTDQPSQSTEGSQSEISKPQITENTTNIEDKTNQSEGEANPPLQTPKVSDLHKTSPTPEKDPNHNKLNNSISNITEIKSKTTLSLPVGIVNLGSTCYINSALQTFFHIPLFRNFIYSIDTSTLTPADQPKSIILNLQSLFYRLQQCLPDVTTKGLTTSFGWSNQQDHTENDIHEFIHLLLSSIESKVKSDATKFKQFTSIFTGKLSKEITHEGKIISKSEEDFTDITLDVLTTSSVDESLKLYMRSSIDYKPEGSDPNSRPISALMNYSFEQFPEVLMLHINRITFLPDFDQPIKINKKFTFKSELDLKEYSKNNIPCSYILFSVIVHIGSAFGGHYITYIRQNSSSDKWIRFSDQNVKKVNEDEAIKNNFGGTYFDTSDFRNREKDYSAYILVYQKIPESIPEPIPISQNIIDYSQGTAAQLDQDVCNFEIKVITEDDLQKEDEQNSKLFPCQSNLTTEALYRLISEKMRISEHSFRLWQIKSNGKISNPIQPSKNFVKVEIVPKVVFLQQKKANDSVLVFGQILIFLKYYAPSCGMIFIGSQLFRVKDRISLVLEEIQDRLFLDRKKYYYSKLYLEDNCNKDYKYEWSSLSTLAISNGATFILESTNDEITEVIKEILERQGRKLISEEMRVPLKKFFAQSNKKTIMIYSLDDLSNPKPIQIPQIIVNLEKVVAEALKIEDPSKIKLFLYSPLLKGTVKFSSKEMLSMIQEDSSTALVYDYPSSDDKIIIGYFSENGIKLTKVYAIKVNSERLINRKDVENAFAKILLMDKIEIETSFYVVNFQNNYNGIFKSSVYLFDNDVICAVPKIEIDKETIKFIPGEIVRQRFQPNGMPFYLKFRSNWKIKDAMNFIEQQLEIDENMTLTPIDIDTSSVLKGIDIITKNSVIGFVYRMKQKSISLTRK